MKTELINETDFNDEHMIRRMIGAAEYAAGIITGTDALEIGLTLTSAENIRSLNREYRGVDSVTDVLSFPLSEFERGSEGILPTDRSDITNPDTGNTMLGDIVINMERVFQQALEYGHSAEREACYLCVHSVLHLLGWDHEDEVQRADMRRHEEEIMNGYGLARAD
ncbi:MAG: rRNA maturation RNase YbeY [Firmicutes bacterium]|nr:rRNA maturation RNase YbeY [Bacillota bacterium]